MLTMFSISTHSCSHVPHKHQLCKSVCMCMCLCIIIVVVVDMADSMVRIGCVYVFVNDIVVLLAMDFAPFRNTQTHCVYVM